MPRTILTHTSPNFLRQLTRQHLTGFSGLTIVPNLAAGRSLRQLTRRALPTITFAQQARRHLFQAGWQPLNAAEKTERLDRLMRSMDFEYFGPLLDKAGTVETLGGIIRTLLRSDASALPQGRSPRERDLARLHRSWVLGLLRDGRYDPAVPEFFAARTALQPQPLLISGFAFLDAAQVAYLDRLADDHSVLVLAAARQAELSEAHRTAQALTARGWFWQEVEVHREDDSRLARIGDLAAHHFLQPDRRATDRPLGDSQHLQLYILPSIIEEVREVLRQVKLAHGSSGRPWHEMVIVVRDQQRYLPFLLEHAQLYGIPLLSQARMPLVHTPLGSLLMNWLEAHQAGWTFDATRTLLFHPLLRLPFDPHKRARAFGQRAPDGLQSWGEEPILTLLDWPEHSTGRQYLEHLTQILQKLDIVERQVENRQLGLSLHFLKEALSPLNNTLSYSAGDFLAAFKALIEEGQVPAHASKGGVRVVTPLAVLGRSYAQAWIMGMGEGLFPQQATDSPLLDAHLRAFWSQSGVYLPGAVESQALERSLFFHALACAREQLTLTCPETVEGRPMRVSPFLKGFPSMRSPVEFYAASVGEARVQQALAGQLDDLRIQAAAQLEQAREMGADHSPTFPGLIDPQQWRWSASQLHQFGACHYRWFGNKIMGLQASVEPLKGLTPLSTGSLYHLTLEHLLRPFQNAAAPAPDILLENLPAAFEKAAGELARQGVLEPGPLWAVERKDHLRILKDAVVSPDFLPQGHHILALEKQLDGTFEASGQIWNFTGYADRIDQHENGQLLVTDYKLSKYISRVQDAQHVLNIEIQLPLYLQLTGAHQGRYFSLKEAKVLEGTGPDWSHYRKGHSWEKHHREVTGFLQDVTAALTSGDFSPRPDQEAKACQYCDLQALCRFQSFATPHQAGTL